MDDQIIEAEPMDEPERGGIAEPLGNVGQLRRAAYQAEADPVFFQWQRGEATEAEWLAAVEVIRGRYPHTVD